MRTRSAKTSDLKNTSTKNNHKIQCQSSTPRNQKRSASASSSTTPPSVQNDPGVRNGRLLSPRRRAVVQTPNRDDLICSQHFDSQVIVGWDCNSPDAIRGIKRISGSDQDDVSDLVMRLIGQESDEETFTKRNTPPLLGIWKEESENKLLDNNNIVPHRQRRIRGRHRRKSGKDSAISKDLLSKLSLALDKCPEVDEEKEEQQGEVVDELFPLVEDVTSKRLDLSDDLFNTDSNDDAEVKINAKSSNNTGKSSNLVDVKSDKGDEIESCAKIRSEGDLKLKTNQNSECCDRIGDKIETEIDDDNWSDDELFEEDSFIIKATQVSSDIQKFVSPVFGMKRKSSSDNALPKSKCSRFSFQLDTNDEKNKPKTSTPENFTNLQSKHAENVCSSYNKRNMMAISKPAMPSSMVSRSDNRKPPIPSSRTTFSESKQYTGTQVFNSCANPVMGNNCANLRGNNCANFNKNTPLTRQRTSTSSTYSNSYSVSNAQKPGSFTNVSFKKHNSFSGTGSQNFISSRRRSVSGDKPCDSGTSVQNFYGSCNNSQVKTGMARTYPVACNTTTSNSVKYYTGRATATVSSTCARNIVKTSSNVNNIGIKSVGTYSSAINTTSVTSNSIKSSVTGTNAFASNCQTLSHQAFNKGKSYPSVCTTSVASSSSAGPGSNSGNRATPRSEGKRSSIGSFDTSISDDLLCQLAEPDDLLDSQLDMNVTCVSKTNTCISNTNKSDKCVSSDKSVKQYKFKPSQKNTTSPTVNNNRPQTRETGSTLPKVSASKKEPVPALDQYSEDLFDDDDDMLLADDDGLTEPQILAMLDEVEMLATQQHNNQRNNSDQAHFSSGINSKIITSALENNKHNSKQQSVEKYSTSDYGSDLDGSQGQLAGSQGHPTGSQGHLSGSQGHPTGSQGHPAGSQGHLVGSQGHVTGSQDHLAGSPGQQTGSQGHNSSQSKYSPAEIERKKKEAIERRKLKLRKNNLS